ncbi:MAG: autotransporter outer membrane beta-barrel domain-containing protein [Cohaesibacter sp.]|jgi:hypothetical protein|nr:autotransporter outer membrane beta-barrel domain-containing protein [Cohaesibacter sp.]
MKSLFKGLLLLAFGGMVLTTGAQAQSTPTPGSTSSDTAASDIVRTSQNSNAARIARIVSDRFSPIQNAFDIPGAPGSGGVTGLASGDVPSGMSVWGSVANSWSGDNFSATDSGTVSQTATIGLDKAITDRITVGASVTYSHSDTDTNYTVGSIESNGFTLMPYASMQITDWLSADASFGYSRTNTDQTVGGVSSDYDTDGYIGSFNLNASKWYGSVIASATAGLMVNSNKRASYTDSNGIVYQSSSDDLTQANVGLTLGYWMEPMMPYVSVGYAYDIDAEKPSTPGASDDADEFKLSVGSHIYGSGEWQHVTGGVSLSTVVGRENKESTTAGLNLKVAF